jgi:hypothetical protein
MTTSQPEDLWTDILATEDELPDEQAWHDGPGGRRHGKINVAALAAALAIPAGAATIATIGLMNPQPAYASSGGGTTGSSGGSTTTSSAGGTTGSSGGGATASAPGSTASGNGTTTSRNGTTTSGNGTTVGAARGSITAGWDGTGQQGGQPAQ